MSIVNIRNIQLLNNPARFDDEYQFRITFECVEELQEDIEWKLLYVGDAKSEEYDQELDSCMVGPVPIGVNSFDFTCAPPNPSLLPSTSSEEILGVTVLILTASYRDKEFVRVGYYVNTEYEDEPRRLEPPAVVDFTGLIRNVLVEKPRVTRFNNPWDSETKNPWGGSSGEMGATGDNQAGASGSMGSHLDAPMNVGSNEDARANVFNSPLPPPVVAAAPAVAPSGSVPHEQGSTSASATPGAADVDMS